MVKTSVEMVIYVVEPHESEAKCPTNIRPDLYWYLSGIVLSKRKEVVK